MELGEEADVMSVVKKQKIKHLGPSEVVVDQSLIDSEIRILT